MIEINLVPDVKQDFIKVKQTRNLVISGAIIFGAIAVGVVALLAIYTFVIQPVRSSNLEYEIKTKKAELASKNDIDRMLTIQNQLAQINQLHDNKNITSRLFEVITAINPAPPNQATFSTIQLSTDSNTIKIEGQTPNGYDALEALKKTITGTNFDFTNQSGKVASLPLTENVLPSDTSFGEDSLGKRVLRFTLTFQYNDALFEKSSKNTKVIQPNKQNVTDSFLGIPVSLFGDRATNQKGTN